MDNKQLAIFGDPPVAGTPKKRNRAEAFANYEGFVNKFKPKKTTDDCYTPPAVYDAVRKFVGTLADLESRPVVRPFYPGGDYEGFDYPAECVVVDNPPFSIYSRIVRFYMARGIDFFLFAPHLSCFIPNADCTYVLTNAHVTYDNGAVVNTSFVTNLTPDLRIWLCPELKKALEEAQESGTRSLLKNEYPDNVVTSATLGKIISQNIELKIAKHECAFQSNLDGLRRRGKSIFGNCFLLSEHAAAKHAAARHAAARQRKGVLVELSEKEKAIVHQLDTKSL